MAATEGGVRCLPGKKGDGTNLLLYGTTPCFLKWRVHVALVAEVLVVHEPLVRVALRVIKFKFWSRQEAAAAVEQQRQLIA